MAKKSWQKLKISWEQKELLRWNKKHFSSFLKGFQWSKYHKCFKGKNPTLNSEEILESQKLNFPNVPVDKGLNEIKNKCSKPANVVSQLLFEYFQERLSFFYYFLLKIKPFRSMSAAGRVVISTYLQTTISRKRF